MLIDPNVMTISLYLSLSPGRSFSRYSTHISVYFYHQVLPGWTQGPLPSKIYSGFLDSTPPGETITQHMHYMFFESERDPSNDPVLIWSNGIMLSFTTYIHI